jgi:hypothetical protein
MPLEADLEFFERVFSLGKVRPFQLLKGLEQLIQPIVILFVERGDRSLFVHAASSPPCDAPVLEW